MSTRTTEEGEGVHALSGAYALDAVDDLERVAFERHLGDCSTCRDEVAGFRLTVGRLAASSPAVPPQRLRDSVLGEISRTRQLRPEVSEGGPARRGRLRTVVSGMPTVLAVAASSLLVLVLGLSAVLAVQQDRLSDSEARAQALEELLAEPDLERTEQVSGGGTLRVVAGDGKALVTLRDAGMLPADRDYQLWLVPDSGNPVPSVLLDEQGGRAYLDSVGEATALAVTVEPAGGSQRPTSDVVAVVPLEG